MSITVPGFVEYRLQFAYRLTPNTEAQIPEAIFATDTSGILITDVEAPQKGQRTVNNGHLAMIPFIEPIECAFEGGDIERVQLDPQFGKISEIGSGRVKAAYIIVDQLDRNPALDCIRQLMRKLGTDTIIVYKVVFQQEGMFGRTDGGKKRLKKLSPPVK